MADPKRPTKINRDYDYVIVGGGPIATIVAMYLVWRKRVSTDRLLIIDPNPQLMHVWRTRADAIAMDEMLSGWEDGVMHEKFQMNDVAQELDPQNKLCSAPNPSEQVFWETAQRTIQRFDLATQHFQDSVVGLERIAGQYRWKIHLHDSDRKFNAANVILALGQRVEVPDFAREAMSTEPRRIYHLYGGGFRREELPKGKYLIVGYGTGSGTFALWAKKNGCDVEIFRSHFARNPGGDDFRYRVSHVVRRRVQTEFRQKTSDGRSWRWSGTTPQRVRTPITKAKIPLRLGRVCGLTTNPDCVKVRYEKVRGKGEEGTTVADYVFLGTGLSPKCPEIMGDWARALGLARDANGIPKLNKQMIWQPPNRKQTDTGILVVGNGSQSQIGRWGTFLVGGHLAAMQILYG